MVESDADKLQRAIDALEPDQREDFEERAAIMEYDGEMSRPLAESRALACVVGGLRSVDKPAE